MMPLTLADGETLDKIGALYGVPRDRYEPDSHYRDRIAINIGRGSMRFAQGTDIPISALDSKPKHCECGAWIAGFQAEGPAHSNWCPKWRVE